MGVNSTNKEQFKYFPLRSYCTKNDSKILLTATVCCENENVIC